MKKINFLIIIIACFCLSFSVITKDHWWMLESSVEIAAYDDENNFYWDIQFSENAKALDGKKIRLKGYFYTYSDTSITLLTKNKIPFYGCSADPKVKMIEIIHSPDLKFNLKKKYVIEGILELNKSYSQSNSYTFPYRIRACQLVKG